MRKVLNKATRKMLRKAMRNVLRKGQLELQYTLSQLPLSYALHIHDSNLHLIFLSSENIHYFLPGHIIFLVNLFFIYLLPFSFSVIHKFYKAKEKNLQFYKLFLFQNELIDLSNSIYPTFNTECMISR